MESLFMDDIGDPEPVIEKSLGIERSTPQSIYKAQSELLNIIRADTNIRACRNAFPHINLQSAGRFLRYFTYQSACFIDMDYTIGHTVYPVDLPHIMMDRREVCCLDLPYGCRVASYTDTEVTFNYCVPHMVEDAKRRAAVLPVECQLICDQGQAVDDLFTRDISEFAACTDLSVEQFVKIFAYGDVQSRSCFTSFPSFQSHPSLYVAMAQFLQKRIYLSDCLPCAVSIEPSFLALSLLDLSVGSETSMAICVGLLQPIQARGCTIGIKLGDTIQCTLLNVITEGLRPVEDYYFPLQDYTTRPVYDYTPLCRELYSLPLWKEYYTRFSKTWIYGEVKRGEVYARFSHGCRASSRLDYVKSLPIDTIPGRAVIATSIEIITDMMNSPYDIRKWTDVYQQAVMRGLKGGGGPGDGKSKGRRKKAADQAKDKHNEKSTLETAEKKAERVKLESEASRAYMKYSSEGPPEGSTFPISAKGNRCGAYSVYFLLRKNNPELPELELDDQYNFVKEVAGAMGMDCDDSMLDTETILGVLAFCKIRAKIYVIVNSEGKPKFQPIASSSKFRYAGSKKHVETPFERILWFNNHFEPIKNTRLCNNDLTFCAEFVPLQCCTAPSMIGTSPFLRLGGEKTRINQGKLIPKGIPKNVHVLALLMKLTSQQDMAYLRSCVVTNDGSIKRIYPRGLLLGTDAEYPFVWQEFDSKLVAFSNTNIKTFDHIAYPAMAEMMTRLVAGEESNVHMPNGAPISAAADQKLRDFVFPEQKKEVKREEKVVSRPQKTTVRDEKPATTVSPNQPSVQTKPIKEECSEVPASSTPCKTQSSASVKTPLTPQPSRVTGETMAAKDTRLTSSWSGCWSVTGSTSTISFVDIVKSIPKPFSWDSDITDQDFEATMAECTHLPSYECVMLIDDHNSKSLIKMEYPTTPEDQELYKSLTQKRESSTQTTPPRGDGTPVGSPKTDSTKPEAGQASVVEEGSGKPVIPATPSTDVPNTGSINDDSNDSSKPSTPTRKTNPPPPPPSGPGPYSGFTSEEEITRRNGCIYHTEHIAEKTPVHSFLAKWGLCSEIKSAHSYFDIPVIGKETPGSDRRVFPYANDSLICESKIATTTLHEIKHTDYTTEDTQPLVDFAKTQLQSALHDPVLMFPKLMVSAFSGLLALKRQIQNEKSYLSSFKRQDRRVNYDHAVVENLTSVIDYTGKSDALAPSIIQARINVTAPFVNTEAKVTFGVDETNTLEGTRLFTQAFYQFKRRAANVNIETFTAAQKAVVDGNI